MNHDDFSLGPVLQPITVVPATKLRQPALPPRLLSRRLIQQMPEQWHSYRLVAVSAPAGYGKTTFGALWLQNISQAGGSHFSAWLSLDTDDDTPLRLLLCLAAALAPVVPAAAAAATGLAGQQPPRQTLLLLMDALDAFALPVYIVLDDLHRLQDPAVHDLLATALERSADNVHWLLISRHVLPFSLGKLRLQGQVLEISTRELQLDRSEVEELLAINSDMPVAAGDIDVLVERTQGWIAGILLALLSLRRQDPAGRQPAHTLLNHVRGDNVLMADYLTGELLAHQSEQMRSFLLQCSVAPRLHPGLCDAITGGTNGAWLLQQAADARLFLRPLDDHGEWYELHHLFREMLQRYLHKQYAHDIVGELHLRAAGWLLQQGDMMAGLQMLLAGGGAGQAADLIQRHSRQALLDNQQHELRRWTDVLPQEEIDARPQLLIDLAWLYVLSDMAAYTALTERSSKVLSILAATPAWRDELAAIGLTARFMSGDHTGVYDDAVTAVPQLLATEHHFACGWAATAAAMRAQMQSPATTVPQYAQVAVDAFAAAGYAEGELYVLSLQAIQHINQGAAQAALDACVRALRIVKQQSHTSHVFRVFFPLSAALVLYWQDRIEEAVHYLADVQRESEQCGDAQYILQPRALLHLCRIARGQHVELTPALLEEEEQLWRRDLYMSSIGGRAATVEWQVLRWLALGRPAKAWSTFERLELQLDTIPEDTFPACWMALLTAYTMCGRELERLTPVLTAHLERRERAGAVYDTIRIRLLLAIQQQQLGRHTAARSALRRALHDIEASGYVRMLFNHPKLVSLLRSVDTGFAQKMLQRMNSQRRPGGMASLMSQEDGSALAALSAQEMKILDLLARGLESSAIAEQMVVAPGTVKWHLGNIYKKLGVKSRRQAVAIFRAAHVPPL